MAGLYHIAEIFASLQGEGRHSGMAAVFVRLAGCNLRCSFCDTDFSAKESLSLDELVVRIKEFSLPNVILTGGEPGLQVDADLVERLHAEGLRIHVETNGSYALPGGIDWITCSPKTTDVARIGLEKADEVKLVFVWGDADDLAAESGVAAYGAVIEKLAPSSLCLQPCDTLCEDTTKANTNGAISYILRHPHWRLSLQTHKYLNIR